MIIDEELDELHPTLFNHPNSKSTSIMGGREGFTRGILRHKNINKIVMCNIDEEFMDFYKQHLTTNHGAFSRLDLVINDARGEFKTREECLDIIIQALALPELYQILLRAGCQDYVVGTFSLHKQNLLMF